MKTYLLIVIAVMVWVMGYEQSAWHEVPEPTKRCSDFVNWQSRFVPARCFSNFISDK